MLAKFKSLILRSLLALGYRIERVARSTPVDPSLRRMWAMDHPIARQAFGNLTPLSQGLATMDQPHGTFAPNAFARAIISITERLPNNRFGLRIAMALRRLVIAQLSDDCPFDVLRWGLRFNSIRAPMDARKWRSSRLKCMRRRNSSRSRSSSTIGGARIVHLFSLTLAQMSDFFLSSSLHALALKPQYSRSSQSRKMRANSSSILPPIQTCPYGFPQRRSATDRASSS